MLGSFWEAAGGKLADRWAASSAPALLFWLGGLLAWAASDGGLSRLSTIAEWFERQTGPGQVGVLIAALLAVGASGAAVQRLIHPLLRILEGYWVRPLDPLRHRLTARQADRADREDRAWQTLAHDVFGPSPPTAEQLSALARLEERRRRRPAAANRLMPTRVGNILRGAEVRPEDKYGLDAVVVWPRLWLVLPEATRQELRAARGALDSVVGAVAWGMLFCAFTPLAPIALPIGIAVSATALTAWVPARAATFGDLVEAAFDVHRFALYEHLRWPAPANPEQERAEGHRLTTYLWRGADDPFPTFAAPRD